MENYKKLLLVVVIVLVVFLVGWLIVRWSAPKIEQGNQELITTELEKPEESEPEPEPKRETIKTPLGEFDVEKPEQTMPLPEEEVKKVEEVGVIKITIKANDFQPKEFTAEAGKTVSLLFQSIDSIYVFRFEDPALADVRMSAMPEETRGLSFISPKTPGDYVFYVEKMGFEGTGKKGVMHVR